MPGKIIDTHVHVWDLAKADYPWLAGDTSLLNQTWELPSLAQERIAAGITEGILVQASGNEADTDNMLETAARHPWITGVVVWLPLMDPAETQRQLKEKYFNNPYFCGVRHQIHDEQDVRWLARSSVIKSLHLLAEYAIPFDVVAVKPEHIQTALEVAANVPGLKLVFDHLAQPPIAKKEKFGVWGRLMQAASKHQQFYAKISGLGTTSANFTGWKKDDLRPYIEFALEHFGVDRCFCGGDWPVSLLAGSYTKIWSAYVEILQEGLNEHEQEKVLYHNAKNFYQIKNRQKASGTWK